MASRFKSITSNPAEILWTGIIDESKAHLIEEVAMDHKLLNSGGGLKTLACNRTCF